MLPLWMVLPLILSGTAVPPAPIDTPLDPAVRVGLKLGAQLSPGVNFAGGFDLELNRLSIAPGWTTRLDADILLENTHDGLLSELNNTAALTVNQIYSRRLSSGRRVYAGLGIGYYNTSEKTGDTFLGATYGYRSRVGGKAFLGAEITSTTSIEATVHFIQGTQPLFALQARLKL